MAALIAAVVIGFVNATLGLFLKIITFPLTLLTLGLFWLIINAVVIKLAAAIVPGFHVYTFGAAFWGAIVLSLVNMALKWLVLPDKT
jgi:putative membrane protein